MSEKIFKGKRMVDDDAELAQAIEDLEESAGVAVEANPEESATEDLNKIKVGETIYSIPAELPSLPADADEKTYILKAVNGVLSWIEEEAPTDDSEE